MSLTPPAVTELAEFTGRPLATFGDFATQALAQATLMFRMVTKLTDWPSDPDFLQLAKNAILEMADRLLLEQPYQEIRTGPFQTETIGSYSYSKVTATSRTAQQGLKTGLFWWDIAVDELTVAGSTVMAHGSVYVHHDGLKPRPGGGLEVQNEAQGEDQWPPYIRIS